MNRLIALAPAFALCLWLGAPSVAHAQGDSAKADAHAAGISDAAAFVAEVQQTVELAESGQYGKIKSKDMTKVKEAAATIESLLKGRNNAMELSPEDRLAVYNAQELITSIVRNDDKSRRVCQRVQQPGSRVTKNECLTVAEREARAKNARENLERLQRNVCTPGPGNPCG